MVHLHPDDKYMDECSYCIEKKRHKDIEESKELLWKAARIRLTDEQHRKVWSENYPYLARILEREKHEEEDE